MQVYTCYGLLSVLPYFKHNRSTEFQTSKVIFLPGDFSTIRSNLRQ